MIIQSQDFQDCSLWKIPWCICQFTRVLWMSQWPHLILHTTVGLLPSSVTLLWIVFQINLWSSHLLFSGSSLSGPGCGAFGWKNYSILHISKHLSYIYNATDKIRQLESVFYISLNQNSWSSWSWNCHGKLDWYGNTSGIYELNLL